MKQIVEINDDYMQLLNQYSQQTDKSISDIVNESISDRIIKPNQRLQSALNNVKELEEFKKVFMQYAHEDLEDMYTLINSEEEVPTDRKMLEVYKFMYQNLLTRDSNFLELFEVYNK
ncbi:hypothetical protein [uncultured Staphylococcus sp.]|uniref:hypothetical protein n=1 Tax=uncultured Staphylococcus sp. TaxID=189668 RepID=UPI0025DFD3C7|nr:hypothetical protein [uncultured Staphylococcus sp.]